MGNVIVQQDLHRDPLNDLDPVAAAGGPGQPGDAGTLSWDGGTIAIATAVKGEGEDVVLIPGEAQGLPDAGTEVVVQLLAKTPDRWVDHAGGDVMFGRRYLEPDEGYPLLSAHDNGKTAIELVMDLDSVPDDIRVAVRNNGGGHLSEATALTASQPL